MTVQCVACTNFSLRGSELAQHGLGSCAAKRRHEYVSAVYPRECWNFARADAEREAERRAWLEKTIAKSRGLLRPSCRDKTWCSSDDHPFYSARASSR